MESKEFDLSSSLSSPVSDRWWSKNTVAVVTGANKGIGFALVRRLAQSELTVILTARDEARGLQAVETLRNEGLHVLFRRLDVSDPVSISAFAAWFTANFQALDILVNNAAVSFNQINQNSVEHAETVLKTNFYGAKLLTEALLPYFRSSPSRSRILNITSRLGTIDRVRNMKVKEILQSKDLAEEDIHGVVCAFLEDVQRGTWTNQGWPAVWTDYAVSKLALNSYTKVLANRYGAFGSVSVNCFCPGFTQTSMTGGKGTHTADAAALVGARLALLPPHRLPTGQFFSWGPNYVTPKNSKL
ncbi:(+)-neomenthol dehydrogenase-like [Cucurbita moschata]|uniref:(+)-neomenthol dehydrogenase-like n=1 Tax=Cucurbita moschata TaxID=3662 RepID=A0A6J1GZE8_CUCMO|nr:(+)-neomenthol dehydrogenase-like [Cucurbita moschata]